MFHNLFAYVAMRIPEISDELYRMDDAMKAGFGWELGVFETWDILGVPNVAEAMKKEGITVAPWVEQMLSKGNTQFYRME
ncbi:MAG: hypothetical protein ACK54P_13815, partial [Bacteroidota bacterium]